MNSDSHSPSNPPFWVDAPQYYYHVPRTITPGMRIINIAVILFLGATLLQILALVYSLAPFPYSALCVIGIIVIIPTIFVPTYLMNSRKRADYLKAMDVQENTKHQSGASTIGSAIHVAGHPSLERDQPIVLALTPVNLEFYSFDDPTPQASIAIKDIAAVKTVVYDDERVPHAEVIDSAAQALQIEFNWKGQVCTVLLRAMKQIRPIDWYHAIQQARLP